MIVRVSSKTTKVMFRKINRSSQKYGPDQVNSTRSRHKTNWHGVPPSPQTLSEIVFVLRRKVKHVPGSRLSHEHSECIVRCYRLEFHFQICLASNKKRASTMKFFKVLFMSSIALAAIATLSSASAVRFLRQESSASVDFEDAGVADSSDSTDSKDSVDASLILPIEPFAASSVSDPSVGDPSDGDEETPFDDGRLDNSAPTDVTPDANVPDHARDLLEAFIKIHGLPPGGEVLTPQSDGYTNAEADKPHPKLPLFHSRRYLKA